MFAADMIMTTLMFFALAVVAILAACSSYFFDREEGFGITTQKKSKNDGYSKLMSESDMKKDYGIKKVHLIDDSYDAGGFPVINNGKDAWVDDSGQPHALIMGASGSGKTQAFMFPLIKILGRHGESMIVTDPKGELYENCGALLKEKGYYTFSMHGNKASMWNRNNMHPNLGYMDFYSKTSFVIDEVVGLLNVQAGMEYLLAVPIFLKTAVVLQDHIIRKVMVKEVI
mgnify:CR=1 FL=1